MIDVESRATDLLNPCKFSENLRQQSYVQGNQTNYTPGQTIQITIPNNETVDLSNCYIEFDMSLDGYTDSNPLIVNIISENNTVNAGVFHLYYQGILIPGPSNGGFAWNIAGGPDTTPGTLWNLLSLNQTLISNGIQILSVTGSSVNSPGYVIEFGAPYANPDLFVDPFFVTSNTNATGASVPTDLLVTQNYTPQYPLVEKYCPIANKLQVDFNSLTIVDVANANRLMAAINQMDSQDDIVGKQLETAYYEDGTSITQNSVHRMKIDLSFVDFFKIIHPVQLYGNAQIKINIQLERPNIALICADASNSANSSYLLQNVKFQYHRLTLNDNELTMLRDKIHSPEGLIIPFKSWNDLQGTVLSGQSNANIIFNPARKHFLGCLILIVAQGYYSSANNVRKITTFLRNQVDSYRLRIGSTYFPTDKVNSSSTSFALVEPIRTLTEFCEVVKNKRIINDMELMLSYKGNRSGSTNAANDPTFTQYYSVTDEYFHTSSPLAILCADIGYSNLSSLCNRLALQGVNTSNTPNVVFELNSMTPLQNCDVDIFSYSQEYLQIKPNVFNWIK